MLFRTFHNFKAPIKVLILDIGCFHHDIPFATSNTIPALDNTASGGLPVVVLQGSADIIKKFKIAEVNDSPCSSDHDEYSDPLEITASAGARLSTTEKAGISRQRKVQTNPEKRKRNVRGSVDPNN